jgi:hypothetical protein
VSGVLHVSMCGAAVALLCMFIAFRFTPADMGLGSAIGMPVIQIPADSFLFFVQTGHLLDVGVVTVSVLPQA